MSSQSAACRDDLVDVVRGALAAAVDRRERRSVLRCYLRHRDRRGMGLRRALVRATAAPPDADGAPGWWCLTTEVLRRVDAHRPAGCHGVARGVCVALGTDFFEAVVPDPAGGREDLRRVPLAGGAPASSRRRGPAWAVHCRLWPWGHAAAVLLHILVRWCLARLVGETDAADAAIPAYPALLWTAGVRHDPVREAELDDITPDDVEWGVRTVWEALGWPRPRAGWTAFLCGERDVPRLAPWARAVAAVRDPRVLDDWAAVCHDSGRRLTLGRMGAALGWTEDRAVSRAARLLWATAERRLPLAPERGQVLADPAQRWAAPPPPPSNADPSSYTPVFAWHMRRMLCVLGFLEALPAGRRVLSDLDVELDALQRRLGGETVIVLGSGRY